MPTRLLFLCSDALDKDLVLRWADDGTLPTFRRLLSDSAWGITESPPGLFVGAIWPSFWTSVSPARHARYCYQQLRSGSYDKVRIHPTDTKAPAFWDAISAAGKRVAVVDIPKTHISGGLNGIHVVDWGTHDPDFEGPVTWPESLAGELVARHGRDEVANCNTHGENGEYERLREQLIARVRKKKEMITAILDRERWDCVIASFSESHCVGHQCWHIHDSSHARHDPELARRVGNPIRDVYVAIDAAIGELIENSGPGTEVFVFGSHGMRSHYDATFLLDEILRRLERPHGAARRPMPRSRSITRRAWGRLPAAVRRLLSPLKGPAKAMLGMEDLSSRRSFAIPNNDAYGAIRVNLVGREPHGRVKPGPEFDTLCAELERDLKSFVNVDTGEPIIRRVMRSSELYRGPHMDSLPDLIVEYNRDSPISRVHSEKTGEIVGKYSKCRTGDHSPHGIFFVSGPGVTAGAVSRSISVMDFGPTLASRLGMALPEVDGRSFADAIFTNGR